MSERSMSEAVISDSDLERAGMLSTATLHEASGRKGALPHSLKPLSPGMHMAGRALPVRCPAGDNLWIHRALVEAGPGDILVIDCGPGTGFGYWGEIMATAAIARDVGGILITGGIRDSLALIELGLPTFAAAVTVRGTVKDKEGDGAVGEPVRIGEIVIRRGDLVVGDADGIVCFPARSVTTLIEESEARDAAEAVIMDKLRAGATTLEVYRF